jgi:hypothetical protein
MENFQSINKGARSGIISKPDPQSDWDSFSLTTGIPKDKRGISSLSAGMTTSHHTEPGVEGRPLGSPSTQQNIPQRRGRSRKNKKARETKFPDKPRA